MTKLIIIFRNCAKALKTAVYLKSDQISRLSFSRHHELQAEVLQLWVLLVHIDICGNSAEICYQFFQNFHLFNCSTA